MKEQRDGIDVTALCLTHGRAWVVREAVESFLRQDIPPAITAELLIINDCPGQRMICERPGVRVVNLPEQCPDMAMKYNAGVEACCGRYICPWEDDDISLPHRIAESLALMLAEDAAALRPTGAWCWNHGQLTEFSRKSLFFGGCIFEREYWRECGGSTPDDWADQSAWGNMLAGGKAVEPAIAAAETWFIYRWAGIGFHDSGGGVQHAGIRAQQFHSKVISDPRYRSGDVVIEPLWAQDYPALVADALKRGLK